MSGTRVGPTECVVSRIISNGLGRVPLNLGMCHVNVQIVQEVMVAVSGVPDFNALNGERSSEVNLPPLVTVCIARHCVRSCHVLVNGTVSTIIVWVAILRVGG